MSESALTDSEIRLGLSGKTLRRLRENILVFACIRLGVSRKTPRRFFVYEMRAKKACHPLSWNGTLNTIFKIECQTESVCRLIERTHRPDGWRFLLPFPLIYPYKGQNLPEYQKSHFHYNPKPCRQKLSSCK